MNGRSGGNSRPSGTGRPPAALRRFPTFPPKSGTGRSTHRRPSAFGLTHGCPVEFCWTRGMALIPLGSGRFTDDPDTRRGVNAMRHHNSVFHGLLKHLPWAEFDRLVAAHGADSRVRRLTTKSQLVALLYGQLAGSASLRDIVTGLQSHAVRLYHVGAKLPRRARPWPTPTRRDRARRSANCWR